MPGLKVGITLCIAVATLTGALAIVLHARITETNDLVFPVVLDENSELL
jgi:hypothetical protein